MDLGNATVFACPKCNDSFYEEGNCPNCGEELEAQVTEECVPE